MEIEPPIWRKIANEVEYRHQIQTTAQSTAFTSPPPCAQLTTFEMAFRSKTECKSSSGGSSDSIERWLLAVETAARGPKGSIIVNFGSNFEAPPPTSPEEAEAVNIECAVLESMRTRRNSAIWPWLAAAEIRASETPRVLPEFAPPDYWISAQELYLRLVDPRTGAMSVETFSWYFNSVLQFLFPGISAEDNAAYLANEFNLLTEHLTIPLCQGFATRAPNGLVQRPPPPGLGDDDLKQETRMAFEPFAYFLGVLLEPWLASPAGNFHHPADIRLMLEDAVMTNTLKSGQLRSMRQHSKPGERRSPMSGSDPSSSNGGTPNGLSELFRGKRSLVGQPGLPPLAFSPWNANSRASEVSRHSPMSLPARLSPDSVNVRQKLPSQRPPGNVLPPLVRQV